MIGGKVMSDLEKVYNANALILSFEKCKKNTSWKESIQKYEANLLLNTYNLQQSIINKTHKQIPPFEFDLCERGKIRHIKAIHITDRVIQRSLCDNLLLPKLKPYLIYDNGASLKNKGVGFARERIKTHLHKYYKKYGAEGYILLVDFSKYFDNIDHAKLLNYLQNKMDSEAFEFIKLLMEDFKIDVSYMTDEEFKNCHNKLFNSLEYEKINKNLKTGDKFMRKSMGIGSQISQLAGVFYPHRLDNYCKIVKGLKFYGRYMDDVYIIHNDKDYLKRLLIELQTITQSLGIFINPKKTRIEKLQKFTYLKLHYSLLDNGKVVEKTTNETFRRERRRLKKLKRKLDNGKMTFAEILNSYKSWRGSVKIYGNHYRILKIDNYFNQIFNQKEQINYD